MPLTVRCLNVANLALCGAPFLSGFYSKDMILEIFLFSPCRIFILLLIFLATGITSAYTIRLRFFCLWGQANYSSMHQIFDDDRKATSAMVLLAVITVFGGAFLQYNMLDFSISLFLPTYLKLLTVVVIVLGGWLSFMVSKRYFLKEVSYRKKYTFFSSIWFLVPVSTLPVSLSIKISLSFIKSLDQGWLEVVGGAGMFSCAMRMSQNNQIFQRRLINYLLKIVLFSGLLIVFIY